MIFVFQMDDGLSLDNDVTGGIYWVRREWELN